MPRPRGADAAAVTLEVVFQLQATKRAILVTGICLTGSRKTDVNSPGTRVIKKF